MKQEFTDFFSGYGIGTKDSASIGAGISSIMKRIMNNEFGNYEKLKPLINELSVTMGIEVASIEAIANKACTNCINGKECIGCLNLVTLIQISSMFLDSISDVEHGIKIINEYKDEIKVILDNIHESIQFLASDTSSLDKTIVFVALMHDIAGKVAELLDKILGSTDFGAILKKVENSEVTTYRDIFDLLVSSCAVIGNQNLSALTNNTFSSKSLGVIFSAAFMTHVGKVLANVSSPIDSALSANLSSYIISKNTDIIDLYPKIDINYMNQIINTYSNSLLLQDRFNSKYSSIVVARLSAHCSSSELKDDLRLILSLAFEFDPLFVIINKYVPDVPKTANSDIVDMIPSEFFTKYHNELDKLMSSSISNLALVWLVSSIANKLSGELKC